MDDLRAWRTHQTEAHVRFQGGVTLNVNVVHSLLLIVRKISPVRSTRMRHEMHSVSATVCVLPITVTPVPAKMQADERHPIMRGSSEEPSAIPNTRGYWNAFGRRQVSIQPAERRRFQLLHGQAAVRDRGPHFDGRKTNPTHFVIRR